MRNDWNDNLIEHACGTGEWDRMMFSQLYNETHLKVRSLSGNRVGRNSLTYNENNK